MENNQETKIDEEEVRRRFDKFVRDTILEEGNKLRAEKGWPLLNEKDLDEIDIDETDIDSRE